MGISERPAGRGAKSKASDLSLLKIFINYRHSEASGWARLLYDRLAARFGGENVFLDLVTLEPGTKWLEDLRSRGSTCAAFISLIGPKWASIMSERAGSSEEDHVRAEIERALRKDSAVEVMIPALLDDAVMPSEKDLPSLRSLWPLLRRQLTQLRPERWDADVQNLINKLEQIATKLEDESVPQDEPRPSPLPSDSEDQRDELILPRRRFELRPDRSHYDELVRLMVGDGSVVPFLGSDANSSDRTEPWQDVDSGSLPNADELAGYLAHKLDAASEPADLAQVSQYVSVANGPGDLYRTLKRALAPRFPPSSVHRFLAAFPATLHQLGLPERYHLILTTNYDDALERAFDEAEEPYDLAVYIASGPDKGRFVHVPHDGEPQVVEVANRYDGFPLDEYGEVTRTVIVKIHGTVDGARGRYAWRDNYVITEDDYIDYLSDSPIESIVPQELLGKLKYSHFLFLGYTMRDWNLRVFLMRIFGQHLPNNSWAIQRNPGKLDSRFWKKIGVDLFSVSLDTYVTELSSYLAGAATVPKA
jgi:hypothetical protein